MAESTTGKDIFIICRQIAEAQRNIVQTILSTNLLIVHDDEEVVQEFQRMNFIPSSYIIKINVFNDLQHCVDYVIETTSEDSEVKFVILLAGRFSCDLVTYIINCKQVQKIIILNNPPFSAMLENQSKVTTIADYHQSLVEARFFDSVELACVEENDLSVEPIDRSFKSFDKDFVFRYTLLLCLLQAPADELNNDDLIQLFAGENLATTRQIQDFK
ncbi:unnamed protein product [Adineta ricciae]|uniref:Uncharacterized protein n=1 Tax=Adineta ricciae TaxID=249248 RepID=A0A816DR25_ADIRI|nr:unnamed protein product [Adineta ricciae]